MSEIYCIVDTETTGLKPGVHDVIEVAAIRLEDGVEVGRFGSLVWPGPGWRRRADPKALEVNGIDPGPVDKAPHKVEAVLEMQKMLAGAVLVAHNAPFDAGFLSEMFAACGEEQPPALYRLVCTRQLAREHLFPLGLPSTSMDAIREWMVARGVPGWEVGGGTHRAMRDAEDCLRLFRMLWRKDRAEVAAVVGGGRA